jgi:hypothetical protein
MAEVPRLAGCDRLAAAGALHEPGLHLACKGLTKMTVAASVTALGGRSVLGTASPGLLALVSAVMLGAAAALESDGRNRRPQSEHTE